MSGEQFEDLSPAEIRRIREKLNLSQVEAGELLGGGPRAFTKYEAGTIKPTAATANLLRVLDERPAMIRSLAGDKVTPIEDENLGYLEVSARHVAALTAARLAELMRRLLDAESLRSNLPMDGAHVATTITVADGGEDARIEWKGGPERTRFIPNRLTQYQLKAGAISPAEAAKDVVDSDGVTKDMVREALEQGGTYVMMCNQPYVKKLIKERERRIREQLEAQGLVVAADHILFRDGSQIASWVNSLPSVAAWVLQRTQPGLVGPFHDWSHWAGLYDREPWVPDERLAPLRDKLRKEVSIAGGVVRVLGLSGLGKSRLVHEALGPTDEEEQGPRLSDLVLYAVESDGGQGVVKGIVQALADTGQRVIVVIDRCPPDVHQDLVAIVKRSGSALSLVTIDHHIPSVDRLPSDAELIDTADDGVIDGLIKQLAPNLPASDHQRLVRFAQGFPQMAVLIARVWIKDQSVAAATDEELFERIIQGRKPADRALLQEAAMLLGAFRLLGVSEDVNDLDPVAVFNGGSSSKDLRDAIEDLRQRGAVQQHGRLVGLQPRPLAWSLAERQWRSWGKTKWDAVLFGNLPPRLREQVADRLSELNVEGSIAFEVVKHCTRIRGPLAKIEALAVDGNAQILGCLAEIDAEVVVTLLEHLLEGMSADALKGLRSGVRRGVVHALEKSAFLADTFERAANLLLRLAVSETEHYANSSTGQFTALFPVLDGSTQASATQRLQLLDELLANAQTEAMPIVIAALKAGTSLHGRPRLVGPELHGTRPALRPWRPTIWDEAFAYVGNCMDRLVTLAVRDDVWARKARDAVAQQLRALIQYQQIDRVEQWVATIHAVVSHWPEALQALGHVLQHDIRRLQPGEDARVRRLVASLVPEDLGRRARLLVTDMPWDFPLGEKLSYEARLARQRDAVGELARDLLRDPNELRRLLPQLSRYPQRQSVVFGRSLAIGAADPLEWPALIREAYLSTEAGQRDFGMLVGYYAGLASRDAAAVEAFKSEAARSTDFGILFPPLCLEIGISPSDVALACEGLRANAIPLRALAAWEFGGVFAKLPPEAVRPLFDRLFEIGGDAYSVAIDLMGMYVFSNHERLEELRPQVVKAAQAISSRKIGRGSQLDEHHVGEIMGWMLSKGKDDSDACTVASALAQCLASDADSAVRDLIKPLLPILLAVYTEQVWPALSDALVGNPDTAWIVESALSDSRVIDAEPAPPLLSVPEEVLFKWAHANREIAPAILARMLPVLVKRHCDPAEAAFHPLALRLMNELGDRPDVQASLLQNMHTFGWSGSLTKYFVLFERPLQALAEQGTSMAVRNWARRVRAQMREQFDTAAQRDEEQAARWNG